MWRKGRAKQYPFPSHREKRDDKTSFHLVADFRSLHCASLPNLLMGHVWKCASDLPFFSSSFSTPWKCLVMALALSTKAACHRGKNQTLNDISKEIHSTSTTLDVVCLYSEQDVHQAIVWNPMCKPMKRCKSYQQKYNAMQFKVQWNLFITRSLEPWKLPY